MFLEDELHVSYKLGNMPINYFPFPHFYCENVFSNHFYKKIQENLPEEKYLFPISEKRPAVPKGYKERFVLSLEDQDLLQLPNSDFWLTFKNQMLGGGLKNFLISRFSDILNNLHPNFKNYKTWSEILIVKDKENYALGPHTDSQKKLITILFYFPSDNSEENIGTSIYMPKDFKFTCQGGSHYKKEDFNLIYTAPFKCNSAFGFIKTNNSFHGVEKVEATSHRWLLLYDIYFEEMESNKLDTSFSF
jgi:hypothetical protein